MAKSSGLGGMDTGEILRYAAIGAAIWFAYRWAVSMGYIEDYIGIAGDVVPVPQVPASAQGGGTPATTPQPSTQTQPAQNTGGSSAGNTPGSNTAPGGTGGSGGDVKAQVWEAAKNEANNSGGLLHFWQWNYYLPANLPKVDPFAVPASMWPGGTKPTDAAQVQATPLTVDQWWAMVSGPMGLSGYEAAHVNHWSQQASLWYGGDDEGNAAASDMGVGRF
jgi:hypothetical protein